MILDQRYGKTLLLTPYYFSTNPSKKLQLKPKAFATLINYLIGSNYIAVNFKIIVVLLLPFSLQSHLISLTSGGLQFKCNFFHRDKIEFLITTITFMLQPILGKVQSEIRSSSVESCVFPLVKTFWSNNKRKNFIITPQWFTALAITKL